MTTRNTDPRTLYNYGKVEIGTKYRRLTLVEKSRIVEGKRGAPGLRHCEWLLRCDCGNEAWLKRHEVVSGMRWTCGIACRIEGATKRHKRSKVREAGMAPLHFDLPDYAPVEKRKMPDKMAVWTIYRTKKRPGGAKLQTTQA